MILAPKLAYWAWPYFLEAYQQSGLEKWQFSLFVTWFWHILLVLITNAAMWAIYHVELPFFERYKITNDPWPWVENKEEWNKLLWKSIKMVAFNNFVSFPLAFVGFSFL